MDKKCSNCKYGEEEDSFCCQDESPLCEYPDLVLWEPKEEYADDLADKLLPLPKGKKLFVTSAEEYKYDLNSTYYSSGGIETLEIIKSKLTDEQYKGWLLGNLIKYSCRANFKGSFWRDIQKINNYSQWLKELEEENE